MTCKVKESKLDFRYKGWGRRENVSKSKLFLTQPLIKTTKFLPHICNGRKKITPPCLYAKETDFE